MTGINWVLLAEFGHSSWGIEMLAVEPALDAECMCVETGGIFRIEIAGVFDAKALVANRRLLRFYPVRGSEELQRGFHMVDVPTGEHGE